jgi:putative endonuclease
MAQHNEVGKKGEEAAEQYLVNQGYTILEKNWYYNKAEVDIIAQHRNTLVVVEVKTRSSLDFGAPQNFVTPKKIKLLVNAIDHYINVHNLNLDIRFDIISVHHANNYYSVEHIPDAFLFF